MHYEVIPLRRRCQFVVPQQICRRKPMLALPAGILRCSEFDRLLSAYSDAPLLEAEIALASSSLC